MVPIHVHSPIPLVVASLIISGPGVTPFAIVLPKISPWEKVSILEDISYLLPQCHQPLLLGMRIDVRTNNKGDDVEERNPRLLW